jgi:ferric-dicitrate binding protein FerR (iron transport regulator)
MDLPDGSKVLVGPASSVRVRDGYGQGAREVDLIGEAMFTVTHDEKHPFRVFTAGALVEDLGTEFTVRAFENEPVRVAVSEGSVSVRRPSAQPGQAVTLQPRDVVVLADTGDLVVTRGVDVEVYRAWTRGMLVFRNTTLRDAIVELERWYDVDFRIADDAMLSRRITVDFDNQPVDEMLKVLGTMFDAQFERRGRVVSVEAPVRTGMTPSSAVQVGSGA